MKFGGGCWAKWEQFFIYLHFNCTIASIDTYWDFKWHDFQLFLADSHKSQPGYKNWAMYVLRLSCLSHYYYLAQYLGQPWC